MAHVGDKFGGDVVDRFRIIVRDASNQVVNDNRLGVLEDIDQAYPQAITKGSMVIHN